MLKGYRQYLVSTCTFLLVACEEMPEYQVPITLEPEYTYVPPQKIEALDEHGYLMFNTTALSEKPLHKIYDEYRFHYAHFRCPVNDQFTAGNLAPRGGKTSPGRRLFRGLG